MKISWKDSLYRQRKELAHMLNEPLARLSQACISVCHDRQQMNSVLADGFSSIPYCSYLYVLDSAGIQLSDNIAREGVQPGHYGRDRSQRPYMKEVVPSWGYLLSDAYISLYSQRPSLTALHVLRTDARMLGYLGADFDLRDLPVTSELYDEPGEWRQIKGDPAIRRTLFQQTRITSLMDEHMQQSLSILEELMTERGVFQCQVHFSSSQATIWLEEDPYRYRVLDREAFMDPDICLLYPCRPYPREAQLPKACIGKILSTLRVLRDSDETIYLRTASLNLFNGLVSVTFSCDGSHYMRYDEFLQKDAEFWFGSPALTA